MMSLQKWVAAAIAISMGLTGCVRVNHETRVERGPVLRSFDREVPVNGGGVLARVDVRWPELTLGFSNYELCRQERVQEVVEERITESSAPSAGPAFALGVTGTAVGGGLLAFRGAFSDEPNRRYIDERGNYGPSARTAATTWSVILLGVGLPALVTGVIGVTQSGEKTESRKVEHVVSAMENPCRLTPADGEVQLVRAAGGGPESLTLPTKEGKVTFTSRQLSEFRLASVHMNGRLVLLPEEESAKLTAFLSCNEVLPVPSAAGLSVVTEQELVNSYNTARLCASVAGPAGEAAVAAYGGEIQRRRHGGVGPDVAAGPRIQSFEEALTTFAPKLEWTAATADAVRAADATALAGQAVRVQGTLARVVEANILLLDVGGAPVLLFVPTDVPWTANFQPNVTLEVVGVVVGRQRLGDFEAPLVRAVWARES